MPCCGLKGGEIRISAAVSSQFVSSILLSSPAAQSTVTLRLDHREQVVSEPYIAMTVQLLKQFGVSVTSPDAHTVCG